MKISVMFDIPGAQTREHALAVLDRVVMGQVRITAGRVKAEVLPEEELDGIALVGDDGTPYATVPESDADPYEDTVKDPENLRMRAASGRVNDPRPLVAFLYELARDNITTGALEPVIDRLASHGETEYTFTNGWLAQWAQDAAGRLSQKEAAK